MFSESLGKKINELIEEIGSNKISVFTNNLKIEGYIYLCEGKCKSYKEHLLTLKDAIVCNIEDYCTCDEDDCECNDYICFRYDWLNLNADKIVGFSVIK